MQSKQWLREAKAGMKCAARNAAEHHNNNSLDDSDPNLRDANLNGIKTRERPKIIEGTFVLLLYSSHFSGLSMSSSGCAFAESRAMHCWIPALLCTL